MQTREEFINEMVENYNEIEDLQDIIEARCMQTKEDEDELYWDILATYFVMNANLKVEKVINNDGEYANVLVIEQTSGMAFWVDVRIDFTDIEMEWNEYIFEIGNSKDEIKNRMQENDIFYDIVDSLVCETLIED